MVKSQDSGAETEFVEMAQQASVFRWYCIAVRACVNTLPNASFKLESSRNFSRFCSESLELVVMVNLVVVSREKKKKKKEKKKTVQQ